jgi:hypothetical protein
MGACVTPPTINGLAVRRALGPDAWGPPLPYGPDGFAYLARRHGGSVVVTAAVWDDGVTWIHASIARPDRMPTYEELTHLHRAVYGENRWAYQCFAPITDHVNIHQYALHLWGRADGEPATPNFGACGSI